MRLATGTVVSGKVVLDDAASADGTDVLVLTREVDEMPALSSEELAELEAGIAEADRRRDDLKRRLLQALAPPRVAVALQLFISRGAARQIDRMTRRLP